MKKGGILLFGVLLLSIAIVSANYVQTSCPSNATVVRQSTFFTGWNPDYFATGQDAWWWNQTNSSLAGKTVKIDYNGTSACRQITYFTRLNKYPAVALFVNSYANDTTYPWQPATITLYK
jgi:hypothetical protein